MTQLAHSQFAPQILERTVPDTAKLRPRSPHRKTKRGFAWRKWIVGGLGMIVALVGLLAITGFIVRRAELNRMISQADPARGRSFYKQSCIVCHGANYQGMPHQGVSLRDSTFIAQKNDEALWDFLKVGRRADDQWSQTKLLMPPRGANPNLDDEDLMDIVAFLRTVNKPPATPAPAPIADAAMQ